MTEMTKYERFDLIENGVFNGFNIESTDPKIDHFLQLRRYDEHLQIWIHQEEMDVGIKLDAEQARMLGLALIEQAYEFERGTH